MDKLDREYCRKIVHEIMEAFVHNEDIAVQIFIRAHTKTYQNGLVDGRTNGLREAQEALERMITGEE